MTATGRPSVGQLAYYRGSWVNAPDGEPVTFWYEVDQDGCVLRQIEIFADGRVERDDIANYPERGSDFGFGTLHGVDFYAEAYVWPKANDVDQLVMLDAQAFEFEAIWAMVESP
ncbi:DUF6881 domain-containing protein [Sphingomonas koreensis]